MSGNLYRWGSIDGFVTVIYGVNDDEKIVVLTIGGALNRFYCDGCGNEFDHQVKMTCIDCSCFNRKLWKSDNSHYYDLCEACYERDEYKMDHKGHTFEKTLNYSIYEHCPPL